ncbi:MAG: transaldolase family protein, partial [Planctomycetota bacterium]
MTNKSIRSLIDCGTKLYLDSIDPDLVELNLSWGAVGATSNPIIVADLIGSGKFDSQLNALLAAGDDDETIAWKLTDQMVNAAQEAFHSTWEKSNGNTGWVSFELDPLIEDPDANIAAGAPIETLEEPETLDLAELAPPG